MSKKWRDDFKGTGSMKKLTDEVNSFMNAMNNINVKMPRNYEGQPVSLAFIDNRLVLDFGDALVFSLNNVEWVFSGTANIVDFSAQVFNGRLVISVEAT